MENWSELIVLQISAMASSRKCVRSAEEESEWLTHKQTRNGQLVRGGDSPVAKRAAACYDVRLLWLRLWPMLLRDYGKCRRQVLPRVDQCHWKPPRTQPNPVELVDASHDRLPELLPIKWARMVASPFGFFRGAVPLMAADLASPSTSGITVQICGDATRRHY